MSRLRAHHAAVAAYERAHTPGHVCEDGSVYVGFSPDTGRELYAMPATNEYLVSFQEKESKYIDKLNAEKRCGHDDWRAPTKGELNLMFEARNAGALSGTFNESSAEDRWGLYWTSEHEADTEDAWAQHFADGAQKKAYHWSLAAIRGVRSP